MLIRIDDEQLEYLQKREYESTNKLQEKRQMIVIISKISTNLIFIIRWMYLPLK